jgi:hypothetical protein
VPKIIATEIPVTTNPITIPTREVFILIQKYFIHYILFLIDEIMDPKGMPLL